MGSLGCPLAAATVTFARENIPGSATLRAAVAIWLAVARWRSSRPRCLSDPTRRTPVRLAACMVSSWDALPSRCRNSACGIGRRCRLGTRSVAGPRSKSTTALTSRSPASSACRSPASPTGGAAWPTSASDRGSTPARRSGSAVDVAAATAGVLPAGGLDAAVGTVSPGGRRVLTPLLRASSAGPAGPCLAAQDSLQPVHSHAADPRVPISRV